MEATNLEPEARSSLHRRLQFPIVWFLQSPFQNLAKNSGILNRTRPDPLAPPDSISDGGAPEIESGSGGSDSDEVSIRIYGDSSVPGEAAEDDREILETSPYQRYDIQPAAKLLKQILPFSLLLLVVFIRQHLQAFVVAVYITAVLIKSDDILRKQTALKGERRFSVLLGYSVLFTLHIFGIYLWNRKHGLLHPLFMIPPKKIPPFRHAIFAILVNGPHITRVDRISQVHFGSYATTEQVNAGDLCAICQEIIFEPCLVELQALILRRLRHRMVRTGTDLPVM